MRRTGVKKLIQLSVVAAMMGYGAQALASGFQLFEANGEGTGNFYADAAAGIPDASTAYYNPAGLMYLPHPQVVVSAVNIFYDAKFKGTSTWSNPVSTPGATYTQSGTTQGGAYALVPGFDVALPINNSMAFGFAVAAPFGLKTTFDDDAFTRYAAAETSVQVLDYSPALAFKFTNNLSFGIGADAEKLDAVLNGVSGLPPYAQLYHRPPNALDTRSRNDASGWGYGWHTGVIYQLTPETRLGITYRSKVSFTVDGTSKFEGPLAGGPVSVVYPNYGAEFENDNLTADTTLPASTSFGFAHQFDPQWAMAATATYTEWSVFDNIELKNVAAANSQLQPDSITVNLPEKFHNTWRFALGGSYAPCDQWLLRAGLGYDQNPTQAAYRNIRLPDGNRFAAAIGAHYQMTKALGVDAGWTHMWFQDGEVHNTTITGSQQTRIDGKAESSADLLGLQLTWTMA